MNSQSDMPDPDPARPRGDSSSGADSEKRFARSPSNDIDPQSTPTPSAATRNPSEGYRRFSLFALVALITVTLGLYGKWLFEAKGLGAAAGIASSWLNGLSRKDLGGYALVLGPLVLLIAVVVIQLVRHGLPDLWRSARQSTLAGMLFGACLVAIGLLSTVDVSVLSGIWWLYFVPVVPPVLLAYQALVVWRQRPRSIGRFTIGVSSAAREALEHDGCWERYMRTYRQLLRVFGGIYDPEDEQEGGAPALRAPRQRPRDGLKLQTTRSTAYTPSFFVTHFAIPALLLGVVGLGAVSLAISAPQVPEIPADIHVLFQRGLRWGVAGAFVYVLIEFGSRLFRGDLTVGAATWAIATLIVGPALAALLAVGWKLEPTGQTQWQICAVLFFAGLAPRRVVSIVESAALQLLKAQGTPTAPPKITPLTNLRGISPELAARLREENIDDVSALAYADPIRLVQSLPYDLRQVVDWIDEALLATILPKHYDALLDRGSTGAIDLAWRWLNASIVEVDGEWQIKPDNSTAPDSFLNLAGGNAADATAIYEAAALLFYEEQVCLLWVMYNCFSTTAGTLDGDAGANA